MPQDYTHITIILDRTGSMESIRDDTIGGFNTFLTQQQAAPGSATLTLVQFDSQNPYEIIHRFRPIRQVPKLTRAKFVPRASTPLLDALGRGINDLEQSLAELEPEYRPAKIVFVVVTDGQENASQEFRKDQIEKMIKARTEQNHWQFVFLSADLAAIEDAGSLGFANRAMQPFAKTQDGVVGVWHCLARNVQDFREDRKDNIDFTSDDNGDAESKRG